MTHSTEKNPSRVAELVKAAKLLIVPPHQYAKGAIKKSLDSAVVKLKGKRGLNGVVGEGAGPFSDKAMQKAGTMEKKAVDQKTKDRALAGTAVASGAALGAGLAYDAKKSRVASRLGTKGAYKHMSRPPIEAAEKRLADSAKTMRRMAKPLRRAGIRGAVIGGLAGTALGVAHLKKEAAAKPARIPKQEYLGKGPIPKSKDVTPHAVMKRKAGKVGKVAIGVAAAAGLAAAAKKHLEKKAEKKEKSSIPGMAVAGAGAAYARRQGKDTVTALKGMGKQIKHIASKGGQIRPMDVRMAFDSFRKPMARRALKSAGKGAAVGVLVGAAMDRMKGHKKEAADTVGAKGDLEMKKLVNSNGKKGSMAQMPGKDKGPLSKKAAEMIERGGKKYRKGTPTSAAANMAAISSGIQIAGNAISAKAVKKLGMPVAKIGLMRGVPRSAVGGAALGYVYGKLRGVGRKRRGEESLNHSDFAKMKAAK